MPGRTFLALLVAPLAACLLAVLPARAAEAPPAIAAAASLRYALDEAAVAFARSGGGPLRLTYAASGSLVQQVEAGAPYQLFLSADEAHVFRLAGRKPRSGRGQLADRGQVYAVGRLALVAPRGSPLKVDARFQGLRQALAAGSIAKFAIANPEIAPYGLAARQALVRAGLWDRLRPHLVQGENVGQAFQFAATGGADGALVSLSLVKSPGFTGRYAVVPAEWHQPLVQRMLLLPNAGPTARAFHRWLLSPAGHALLARHGYAPPLSAPPPPPGAGRP